MDVVGVAPGARLVLRRGALDVHRLSPGAVLAAHAALARRHWPELEKSLTSYLVHEHVTALMALYGVNCVLDVGANRGQYAKRLRRSGFDGYIVSFEPVPEVLAQLRAAAAGDPKWTVHPYALGREDGVKAMNVVPGTLSSLLAPNEFGRERYAQWSELETVKVPVRRLDGMLDELLAPIRQPRPYLKLDT